MNTYRVSKSWLVVAGILVATSLAFGKFLGLEVGHSSKKPSANIMIVQTSRLADGPTLSPGSYKVVLSEDSPAPEIDFYQDGKLVAQAPAKLVERDKKFDKTEVHYNNPNADTHVITQMDLSGWKEEVSFGKK